MTLSTRKLPSGVIEAQLGSLAVLVREKDGYINATRLCKDGGKQFKNWMQLDGTAAFLQELAPTINAEPVNSITTGDNESRGTWIHPKAAINLAQWISPEFAVKVSDIVLKYYSGDLTLVAETVKQHDAMHGTTSTVQIGTVLGKRKAELELAALEMDLREQEARVVRMEYEARRDHVEVKIKTNEMIREALTKYGVMDAATEQFLGSNLKTDLLLLGDGSGPSAEDATVMWPVVNRAQKLGFRLKPGQDATLGRKARKAYEEHYGKAPGRKTIFHKDSGREVFAYTESECLEVVDDVITKFFV